MSFSAASLVRNLLIWPIRRSCQLHDFTIAAEKLIPAFVSSRLDNGNSVLYGQPDYQLEKLQRVHNTAARILTKTSKYDHITPILFDLHWLPIKQRIIFKLMTLTYRCLNGLAPQYLSQHLIPYSPTRSLRSSDAALLTVPKSRTQSYGARAFQNCSPRLWNCLPLNIRQLNTYSSFKRALKHHLFTKRNWTLCGKCAI